VVRRTLDKSGDDETASRDYGGSKHQSGSSKKDLCSNSHNGLRSRRESKSRRFNDCSDEDSSEGEYDRMNKIGSTSLSHSLSNKHSKGNSSSNHDHRAMTQDWCIYLDGSDGSDNESSGSLGRAKHRTKSSGSGRTKSKKSKKEKLRSRSHEEIKPRKSKSTRTKDLKSQSSHLSTDDNSRSVSQSKTRSNSRGKSDKKNKDRHRPVDRDENHAPKKSKSRAKSLEGIGNRGEGPKGLFERDRDTDDFLL